MRAQTGADRMSRAMELLQPAVQRALARCPAEFTTRQLIQTLLEEPEGQAAYRAAVALWDDFPAPFGQRTVHGLIVPRLLRASGQVRWAGYIHDPAEDDGLAVPSRWHKVVPASEGEAAAGPDPGARDL